MPNSDILSRLAKLVYRIPTKNSLVTLGVSAWQTRRPIAKLCDMCNKKTTLPRVSRLRARLYEATGRRLALLGLGVLIVLALITVATYYFEMRLIEYLISHGYSFGATATTAGGTSLAALLGLARVIRGFSPRLQGVANIIEAKKPETAGLVIEPQSSIKE